MKSKKMKRVYMFPVYFLKNRDKCSFKLIFSITNKRAINKAEKIIDSYGGDWIFDKIVLIKVSNNKIVKKWY